MGEHMVRLRDDEVHRWLKILAVVEGVTVTQALERIVREAMARELGGVATRKKEPAAR